MRGLAIILYGSEGIGKTSLALQFSHLGEATCLSIKETGFDHLKELPGVVPDNITNINVSSWEELVDQTKKAKKVLILDSLSGLQYVLFDYVCRTAFEGKWAEFTSYYKGQRTDAPAVLVRYIDLLDAITLRGTHVIMTGHMITEVLPNTLGADYKSHSIDMDQGDKGGVRSIITKWAQAILFMHIDISITRATDITRDKVVMEGKAKDDDNRLIYTTRSPGHMAKNRLNLPPIIPMGSTPQEAFKSLWVNMPQSYQDLL